MGAIIFLAVLVIFALVVAIRSIRIVPQARVVVIQRLGRYLKTAGSGPVFVVPFIDQILPTIDLREQVLPFDPQPVITEDNVGIQIATVVYFQIVDARATSYEVANLVQAMDQLVLTSLRNVIGGLTLDKTLTSREDINSKMRAVLDEVTEKWGVRVNRVELKDIIPPHDVQQAMEKQMQAERNRRAAILQADGQKQSAVLQAEGEKQSAILRAEGQRQAAVLNAEGEALALVTVQKAQAQAIDLVFTALHEAHPNPEILKYLYLQTLPKMAEGSANKVFVVPSELNNIAGFGATLGASMQQDASTPLIPNGNDGR